MNPAGTLNPFHLLADTHHPAAATAAAEKGEEEVSAACHSMRAWSTDHQRLFHHKLFDCWLQPESPACSDAEEHDGCSLDHGNDHCAGCWEMQ